MIPPETTEERRPGGATSSTTTDCTTHSTTASDDLSRSDEIQVAFVQFDESHPGVYLAFKAHAFEIKKHRHYYSADAIMNRVRWDHDTSAHHADAEFKINNNFTSRYSRKLIAEHPEFAGFFRLRALRSGFAGQGGDE